MPRVPFIFFALLFTTITFSQNVIYSQVFDTQRNNVPLRIINEHPDHFWVLRYNKKGHDFDIEKRSKPDAKMLSFTPLKLENINENWFNFEKLDYLCLENNGKIYFIFEKAQNTHRAIYLKIIDSSGKASDFKELATMDLEKTMNNFRFIFNITQQNKLLIVGEQYYNNSTVKKVALLYDLESDENIWVKKLPIENSYTGFSMEFKCNSNNDLFYVLTKSYVSGYQRKNINQVQLSVPIITYDSISLAVFLNAEKTINKQIIPIKKRFGLKSVSIVPAKENVTAIVHYARQDNQGNDSVFFLAQNFRNDLRERNFSTSSSLSEANNKKLTFYDGSDYSGASDKNYSVCEKRWNENYAYILSERKEENYSKELLFWKTDIKTGKVVQQQVIPRKVFYFDDRTRFKNIGVSAEILCNKNYYCFLLEDANNAKKNAGDFEFHHFSRQKYLWGANLVSYCLKEDGSFEKKVIYKNSAFDFVPLNYSSNQCDFIFYMNNGKTEKFGFLDPGTL